MILAGNKLYHSNEIIPVNQADRQALNSPAMRSFSRDAHQLRTIDRFMSNDAILISWAKDRFRLSTTDQ
jgi:hypothetical protein